MGGGKEKKATNQMMAQDRAKSQSEHDSYMNRTSADWDQARSRNQDMYNSLYGGYKNFAEGNRSAGTPTVGGGGGGGGDFGAGDSRFGDVESSYRNFLTSGGIDKGKFDEFQGNLSELARTGGWSPEHQGNIMGDVGRLRASAEDGAIANRFRGGGVFDEFARTGGYNEKDISNIRTRANSVIPAYYDIARREAARQSAVQGGYGPGRSALMSRMSREQARGAAANALDAELGIRENVNAGRKWGASGMSSSEGAYQDMRHRALTGASGIEGNMVNSIAANRAGAAGTGATNETGMQAQIQQGKMFGTQGLNSMAEAAAARSAAAAAHAAANDRWERQFAREGEQYGLEGMRSLYGMEPGETGMYINANLAGRGLTANTNEGLYDARMRNNPERDWLGTIGALAGAGAGVMTGAGALGFGRNAGRNTGITGTGRY